jgi:hypothetical protein
LTVPLSRACGERFDDGCERATTPVAAKAFEGMGNRFMIA